VDTTKYISSDVGDISSLDWNCQIIDLCMRDRWKVVLCSATEREHWTTQIPKPSISHNLSHFISVYSLTLSLTLSSAVQHISISSQSSKYLLLKMLSYSLLFPRFALRILHKLLYKRGYSESFIQ
jgi:hypothetical protein